ncbi:MAG: hypothetical protein ACLVAW_30275 [Eisenbergiella massiliensis]
MSGSNDFCPQCLYLYGTYKENREPNYGLFCWATYCWDEGLKFVACIGQDKLTRDRIRTEGVFFRFRSERSASARHDFCGTHPGYEFDKSEKVESEKGGV